MSSRPNPLTPSPSNLSRTLTSTHTHHQHISPHRHLPHCIQAGSGYPTAKKPTLNTSLLENYRPVSLLPFIAKTLERVVFNQVSLFISQNNKLDTKQSGFRSGHSTETVLLSVNESQWHSGWTSIKHNQTSTNDSESSSAAGLQRAKKSPCYTSLYLLALATSCSLHQVQDTDACI